MLDPAVLTDELRKFMDESHGSFIGFPEDELDAAEKWAAAIDAYAGTNLTDLTFLAVVTPLAASGAKTALVAGLSGMSVPAAGPGVFDVAMTAYAAALGVGMQPGHTATPPVLGSLVVSLAASAAAALPPNPPKPPAVQLAIIAGVIDAWFRTGTATPSGGGSPAFWA